jgi:sec-independent protein translocase protein TatB
MPCRYHAACYVAYVFGLSFGELVVLLLVAIVVLGPKDVPRYLRKAGEFAGRLRRMAFDMRERSGIDDVLRAEGIDRDIAEIRKLARGEIGGVVAAVRSTTDPLRPNATLAAGAAGAAAAAPPAAAVTAHAQNEAAPTTREYPPEGADSYGALPDTSKVYEDGLPLSPLADDLLYARGKAAAKSEAADEAAAQDGVADEVRSVSSEAHT